MKRSKLEFENEMKVLKEEWLTVSREELSWDERQNIEREKWAEWINELEVGDHAHINHYTDITPCTVIKRTRTTITVRHDDGELDGNWKPEIIQGGFVGHCVNNREQMDHYIIHENPNGYVETFRWSKKYNKFRNASGESCYPEWAMFYDYNF